mgnify:FL=1
MLKRNIFIAVVLFFASNLLNAQSHNEQVTVQGSYTPQIKKSERITSSPGMPKNEFNIPKYEVNTEDFFYDYKIDLEPISPMQYTNSEKREITNNFIKAGFGTRLSPDFLFHHYSDLSKKTSLGVGIDRKSVV